MAVKWGKCAFFMSDIEWLGFKISGDVSRQSRRNKNFANPEEYFRITCIFRLKKPICKIRS